MDAKSNVLTMYVVRGEQLSHPRAQQPDLSQHPSAAFSQINQQPLPIHVSFFQRLLFFYFFSKRLFQS